MANDFPKVPNQEELERELSEYLSKKYGYRIKVISPMMMSQTKESSGGPKTPTGVEKIKFDMKPEELEAYLDSFVIRQDEAKAVLATKICTHYNRIKFQHRGKHSTGGDMVGRIKNNVLLIGPTGVGKTYLVKLIAKKLGVPFVKGDATKFSETGYVGGDVEDLVRELLIEADDDVELAQYGIIYVDEVDKIASSNHFIGPDVSRTGVQRALLKPMEETEVDIKVPHDPISQLQALEQFRKTGKYEKRTINTKNILFIMSGAFNGLSPIVRKRIQKQGIGFGAQIESKDEEIRYVRYARAEDLIAFGFESEFVGRIPVVAALDPLEPEDLHEILRNRNSPIILGKKEDFRSYGIDIKFEDPALRLIAEMASEEKTGARGLVSVLERVLLPYEKKLPSTSIRYLVVTRDVVVNPRAELDRILADPDSSDRLAYYRGILSREKEQVRENVARRKTHYVDNYPLVFSPERIEMVLEHHLKTGMLVESIFDEVILLYNQIRVFEADFQERHGYKIRFDDEAFNEIIAQALLQDTSASAICNTVSRDYDYGFRLISEKRGKMEFVIPKVAVLHPEIYLDQLIRDNFRQHPLHATDAETNPKRGGQGTAK